MHSALRGFLSWSGEASTAAIFEDEGPEAAAEADVSGLSWSGEATTAAIFEEKDESDQADLAKLTAKELKALLKGKAVSGKALCTLSLGNNDRGMGSRGVAGVGTPL